MSCVDCLMPPLRAEAGTRLGSVRACLAPPRTLAVGRPAPGHLGPPASTLSRQWNGRAVCPGQDFRPLPRPRWEHDWLGRSGAPGPTAEARCPFHCRLRWLAPAYCRPGARRGKKSSIEQSQRPREGVSTTPATATDACSILPTGYKRKARIYCPRDRGITEIRVASKRPHTPALPVKKAPATAGHGRPAPVKVPLFFSFPIEIWSYPATRSGLDAVTD